MVDGSKDRSRPHSPVKLLANIFGGSTRETPVRKQHNATLSLTDIPHLQPNMFRRNSDDLSTPSQNANVTHSASSAIEKLEETLSSYILANTEHLHRKIAEMNNRIRQLEDALAIAFASLRLTS